MLWIVKLGYVRLKVDRIRDLAKNLGRGDAPLFFMCFEHSFLNSGFWAGKLSSQQVLNDGV